MKLLGWRRCFKPTAGNTFGNEVAFCCLIFTLIAVECVFLHKMQNYFFFLVSRCNPHIQGNIVLSYFVLYALNKFGDIAFWAVAELNAALCVFAKVRENEENLRSRAGNEPTAFFLLSDAVPLQKGKRIDIKLINNLIINEAVVADIQFNFLPMNRQSTAWSSATQKTISWIRTESG